MDATAIILAAGEGTRMKSNHCKVSHKILGKPMVQWIVDATIKAGCSRVVVVIGSHADEMRALIDGAYANSATKVECVEQTERRRRKPQPPQTNRYALVICLRYHIAPCIVSKHTSL